MILQNFSLQGYAVVVFIGIFLSLVDAVITFMNSRLYENYYSLEILPWVKMTYKYSEGWFALIVNIVENLALYGLFFILPLKITWMVILLGFWIYRAFHSAMRLYLWVKYRQ